MNYSDIIYIINKSLRINSYLELGCQFGATLSKSTAKRKIGVDIEKQFIVGLFEFYEESTDDFFKHFKDPVDSIFIDADHNFESVKRDFSNSMKILKTNGIIFIHDTDPNAPDLLRPEMCGDSYRVVDWIRKRFTHLDLLVLPADEPGLTLVRRKEDRRIFNYLDATA